MAEMEEEMGDAMTRSDKSAISAIQATPSGDGPTGAMTPTRPPSRPPPTPRAQMARVLVASSFALLVGIGPAVAWDVSTQPPRAEAPSPWPRPSPWETAGSQMAGAVKGIARIYLPSTIPSPPDESAAVTPSLPPLSSATPVSPAAPTAPFASAVVGGYVPPLPRPMASYWVGSLE
jgi:hypothetical protein